MELKMVLVFLIVCFISWNLCHGNGESMKLDLVQVAFRHGYRTPSAAEASLINLTDPSIYRPEGFSQLTNKGKQQTYKLGSLLRKKYDQFLGSYNSSKLYALSSNYIRTKMSLQLVLAGLYPVVSEEKWNSELNWNPIPYYYTTSEIDVLLAPHQNPNYKRVHEEEIANLEDYQWGLSNYTEFIRFMEVKIGHSFKSDLHYNVGWSHYVIKIHKIMNLPLPNWCTDDVLKSLENLFAFTLDSMSMTQKLKKLNGGTLIKQFVENIINDNINDENSKRMYLYSTHDLTLASFTRIQNITTFSIPPFGSAIILEKYTDSQKKNYVRALSWNGSDEDFVTLRIGICEEFCPLMEYLMMVKDVVPSDEELDFLDNIQ